MLSVSRPSTERAMSLPVRRSPSPRAGCDVLGPAVQLTSPVAGSTVNGVVLVSAFATDDVGVTEVAFSLDGVRSGRAGQEPLRSRLPGTPGSTASGQHTLAAVARDAAGNTAASQARSRSTTPANPDRGSSPATASTKARASPPGMARATPGRRRCQGAGWGAGKFGSAAQLDGIDDRVDVPSLGTFYRASFTLEAWARKRGPRRTSASSAPGALEVAGR